MTLAQMLASLPTEKLFEIQSALIEAGIGNEFNGDYKSVFRQLKERSSGKAKKIYAALAKASREEMKRMSDQICVR